ncbi:uncharacterized protein LOC135817163 [Sycon ciliatum]|uniref:uncharacterized protein LOC135817163 n=1 Tax=Sycon ciliatum TaxID=27933 RepID=UPI0031F61C2D
MSVATVNAVNTLGGTVQDVSRLRFAEQAMLSRYQSTSSSSCADETSHEQHGGEEDAHNASSSSSSSSSTVPDEYCDEAQSTAHTEFVHVVSREVDLLEHVLSFCSDADIVSIAQTCTFMDRNCQRMLNKRKQAWRRRLLQPRADGKCRTAEYAVNLDQLLRIGRLVDAQRDATNTSSAITMSQLEDILQVGTQLQYTTHLFDIVHITEYDSLSKISLIAVLSQGQQQLSFYRMVWRSAHGHPFHLFPKETHRVAEKQSAYRQFFAPYFATNCRRLLPCYAVLPESSTVVQGWRDQKPSVDKELLPRQQMLIGMFPVDRLNLILELCTGYEGGHTLHDDTVQQQQQRLVTPRLITPARFYNALEYCDGQHQHLWWV